MEHKGKTIPKEVKSLAGRIRKEEPDRSDEYAYRTAWDIYRSHTAEGKSYPNKSPESGLKREGGGTGPLSKTSSERFWTGFEKRAGAVSNVVKSVTKAAPAAERGLNYSAMKAQDLAKRRSHSGTLSYTNRTPTFYAPGKSPTELAEAAKAAPHAAPTPPPAAVTPVVDPKAQIQAKLKEQAQKRIARATRGGYTDPQFRRANA